VIGMRGPLRARPCYEWPRRKSGPRVILGSSSPIEDHLEGEVALRRSGRAVPVEITTLGGNWGRDGHRAPYRTRGLVGARDLTTLPHVFATPRRLKAPIARSAIRFTCDVGS
jgi:hypothetical protein